MLGQTTRAKIVIEIAMLLALFGAGTRMPVPFSELWRVTLVVVALSIVIHGISSTPLMQRHSRREERSADELIFC